MKDNVLDATLYNTLVIVCQLYSFIVALKSTFIALISMHLMTKESLP